MSYYTDENGNWKRTVTCGHCYEKGHNKGSCKAKKQSHLDQIAAYEKEIADDNFTDDWERNYAQRNLSRHKAELNKTVNRGKNRKCSYCKEQGHTRRTCSYRNGDMNNFATKTLEAREKFIDRFIEHGLGVGALVMIKNWDAEELAMVSGVNWTYITHHAALGGDQQYIDLITTETLTGRRNSCMLPRSIADIEDICKDNPDRGRRESAMTITSPVDVAYPEDFLTMECCLNTAKLRGDFMKERPYSYHGIEYDDE